MEPLQRSFVGVLFIQAVDVFIHVASGQVETLRISASVMLVYLTEEGGRLPGWVVWVEFGPAILLALAGVIRVQATRMARRR